MLGALQFSELVHTLSKNSLKLPSEASSDAGEDVVAVDAGVTLLGCFSANCCMSSAIIKSNSSSGLASMPT